MRDIIQGQKVKIINLEPREEALGFKSGMTGRVIRVGKNYPPDYPEIDLDQPVVTGDGEEIKVTDFHTSKLRKIQE